MKQSFDYLVLGAGVAGLTFAINAAKHGTVLVLGKKFLNQTSTAWAQGGIAAVTSEDDSHSLHIQDTLDAGAGICDQEIVRIVVEEGPARVAQLIELGANFDKEGISYHLNKEGGHSRRRIFHTGDSTGQTVQQTLSNAAKANPNITIIDHMVAVDLITTHKFGMYLDQPNQCIGAYVLNPKGDVEIIRAKVVMVATGGAGKVYLYTSNPDVSTGDGIAMCFRAGAPVANLEFFQFHPTCLYHPQAKSFLITEAMRGEGAKLCRINGEQFMHNYHELAELAPRDIVARAIDNEMKVHGDDFVYLDISHKPLEFIKEHFPMIYEKCLQFGLDISKQPIPVVPAAHYCCGGVVTDKNGKTSIKNLYVAGEAAYTGLHGANRLASNSLLEGLVFGYRASDEAKSQLLTDQSYDYQDIWSQIPKWDSGDAVDSDEQVIIAHNWDEIRRCMWNYVGIVRSTKRLERAKRRIELITQEIQNYYWKFKVTADLLELRNITLIAQLIVESALLRHESRGLHYTIDYPNSSSEYLKPTVISKL